MARTSKKMSKKRTQIRQNQYEEMLRKQRHEGEFTKPGSQNSKK